MQNHRSLILAGATFALIAVALGAFGAHALKAQLETLGNQATWETAVVYQMWHALALLILASYKIRNRAGSITAICFCLGVPLFSGSLYWLALDGPRWLGPITPLGGLLLMLGWCSLIVAIFKKQTQRT
jgi:uncharacterized membrane protein YgdD (TMEM256/DUF423 family)